MKQNLILLREAHTKKIGQRDLLLKQLEDIDVELKEKEKYLLTCQKVRVFVQYVSIETQKKIEYHFSNLGTLAQAAIFSDPYEFALRFVERRNKTEADFVFIKNGKEGPPMITGGGGTLDVAAFALQAIVVSISNNRKIIFTDEPGRNISRNYQRRFSEMIKMISEKLGIQFIITSHIPEITEAADRIFDVNSTGFALVNCPNERRS